MPADAAADILVIGAGIAGASVGYWLARHGSVTLLERESQPGAHSTGRSAALFMESYGTPQVRALTIASRAFLEAPPDGFIGAPILTPRGALMVATEADEPPLEAHWQVLRSISERAQRLDGRQSRDLVSVLRPEQDQEREKARVPETAPLRDASPMRTALASIATALIGVWLTGRRRGSRNEGA